jgi:nitroreductase
MSPLQALQWRYATKAFDPEKKIPAETMAIIEQSLVLTPSSYGLQPWKFLIVTDKATRETLVPHSWGQRQVADCSHLVVFTVKRTFGEADVDALIARTAEVRGVSRDALQTYRDIMVGDIVKGPRSRAYEDWAKRQTYIALGQLMLTAAQLGVDSCPMEGFVPDKYDEVLGLAAKGLTTSVACPLGYRSTNDKYASAPKVRYPAEQVIERI